MILTNYYYQRCKVVEIDYSNFLKITQNPHFSSTHQPQFTKDFAGVYRNNIHLSPFFTDIKALADNIKSPNIICVKKGGNYLISGDEECSSYDNVLYEFFVNCVHESDGAIWLRFSTNNLRDKICALLSAHNPTHLNRYNFRLNKGSFNILPNWRKQIPDGFMVEYFDAFTYDFRKKHHKTDEAFFPESKRFAFATLFDDKIISECFSVFVENDMAEIGIHTYDDRYKRQGLAFLTASAFIEHCNNNNLETSWSCDYNNYSSISLAKKLGYELLNEEIGVRIEKNDTE